MPTLRRLAAAVSEVALPGNTRPPGFQGQGIRPGGAQTLDWHAVFIDTNGQVMAGGSQGGSVAVQWYAVEIAANGAVTTPTLGSPATADALDIKRKAFGAGAWPWCTVQATPPNIAAKLVYVTVGDDDDGTYSITVTDSEGPQAPVEYDATGKTVEEIRDELVALFVGHPTLTVYAGLDNFIIAVQASTPGYDFTLELSAPGDALTQQELTPNKAVAEFVEIRTTASAAVEADGDAVAAAISDLDIGGDVADAITEACAAHGAIREVVRPDGFGGVQTFVDGPDIGGGAAAYEVVPAQSGKTTVHFLRVEADGPVTWELRSGAGGFTMLGPITELAVGPPQNFAPGAGGFRAWKTNMSSPLTLWVSDRTVEVKVTTFCVVSDDN